MHLEDLGTNIQAVNFVDLLNRFILSKSNKHSKPYTYKNLKGLYGNAHVLYLTISYLLKQSVVLVILALYNYRLVIESLNINFILNKSDYSKLIIQGNTDILVIAETKTDLTFPLNRG